jgi:monoamine oxidase
MTHTPFFAIIKQAMRFASLSNSKNVSANDVLEMEAYYKESRRNFLTNSLKASVAIGASSLMPIQGCKVNPKNNNNPVIAIVGGGISGLNACYQLQKKGIKSTLFEASRRAGGRMLSKQDIIAIGITTEVGAEFIDTVHEDMLNLVTEFGLEMIDVTKDQTGAEKETFFIDGKRYKLAECIQEFKNVLPQINADKDSIDENYENEATLALDNMDMRSYINGLKEGSPWFVKMLDYAYQAEMGLDSNEQSALNFVDYLPRESKEDAFEIFGQSDERFKVIGGNSRITDELYNRVKDQVQLDRKLKALHKESNKYILTFEGGGTFTADIVIMAMPFTILRNVDLDIPEMSAEKKQCIQTLGYGTNVKFAMGFRDRAWRKMNNQGYLFNEIIENGWDAGHMQNDNKGNTGYTTFLGGKLGLAANTAAEEVLKNTYLTQLNKIFPGAEADFNGKINVAKWATNPLVMGSYSCYKVGQWTTISGYEAEPVGNIFFCGEHTSEDFQGFMNGGAKTGRLAAEAVLSKIGV